MTEERTRLGRRGEDMAAEYLSASGWPILERNWRCREGEADIIAWCHEHMAAYKAPRLVEFVDALPKSGSGKVMWRLLQEAARTAAPAAA